jgi:transcriptional regulator with XRE-family HTH domain
MLTPAQSKTARSLLEWSTIDLCARSNLSEGAVRDFEEGRRLLPTRSLLRIRYAFEDAGVEFTNGIAPGVRLCPGKGLQ